jgi:hypothetical protein
LAKLSAQVFILLVVVEAGQTQIKHPAALAVVVQQTCIILLELMALLILAVAAVAVLLNPHTFPVEMLALEL